MTKQNSYFGSISIAPSNTLSRTAEILNAVLDGFFLKEDESGRFEEYPAYIADIDSIELQLVGNSQDDVDTNFYCLTLRCISIDPIDVGIKIPSKLITAIPEGLSVERNGYINISTYLSNFISINTTLSCNVNWVTHPSNEMPE